MKQDNKSYNVCDKCGGMDAHAPHCPESGYVLALEMELDTAQAKIRDLQKCLGAQEQHRQKITAERDRYKEQLLQGYGTLANERDRYRDEILGPKGWVYRCDRYRAALWGIAYIPVDEQNCVEIAREALDMYRNTEQDASNE